MTFSLPLGACMNAGHTWRLSRQIEGESERHLLSQFESPVDPTWDRLRQEGEGEEEQKFSPGHPNEADELSCFF